MKKPNWKEIIANIPKTYAGRGITQAIQDVEEYARSHDLAWCRNDVLTWAILSKIPHCERTYNYHSGSRGKRAYYTEGVLAPRPLVNAASAEAEMLGIHYAKGLIYSTIRPGMRQEWEYSGGSLKWVKVRRWALRDGTWEAPSTRRRYYAAQSVVVLRNSEKEIRTTLRGKSAYIKAKTVTREKVRKNVAYILAKRPAKAPLSERATLRALRRLCPEGWEVVLTPPSQDAAPSPAFRELATGEEYHICAGLSANDRAPRATAAEAFARRREVREAARLQALVDRGEADNVYVCLADSLRAGNCRAGSASYAERHGLDLDRHYRAGELRDAANGDARFVRSAIIAAYRRHTREMRQGFALLSDHAA